MGRIEGDGVQLGQGIGPVDGLGDARRLEQVDAAQPLDEGDEFRRQLGIGPRRLAAHDVELAVRGRIIDPVIEAAALQRVVDLAGAVGGDDDDRRFGSADGAELGDGHLVVGQDFQEERLEGLVGPVELVDQQHRRAAGLALQRLQDRPADEEAFGEDLRAHGVAGNVARGLAHADLDHLRGVVPLVECRGDVEPLVALQPDQRPVERGGQHLGDLGLADTRLAF